MSRPSRLPLRVAVVQMHAHLAFEDDGKLYLGEPLGRPLDRPLLTRLDDRLTPNSPAQKHLAQLRRHIASAYDRGLLARLKAILTFCEHHKADLVVFPEYSIPGSLVPALRDEAHRLGLAIVAGTHLVTTELLGHAPYADAFDPPPASGQAIAPVIIPGDDSKVRYQPKLFPSQWETSLVDGEGPVIFDWKDRHLAFGVAICIDFLRHRDPEGAAAHEKWRDDTDLLIVPSATPKDTPQQFASSADHFYRATHTPVIYSNLAEYGGTGVAGYGKPDGRVLAVGSKIPNLSGGHEGITIVHLDLHNTTDTTPRRYDADTPIRLIAYALILHAESHPALAEVARQLLTASDARTFKQLCHDHEHTLATAARELRDVPLVSARWTSLAKSAQGIHNLDDLRLRATDLWLSDDVPSIPQIEHALAKATIQALRGISADPTSTPEDRAALQDTIDALDKALRDPPIPPTPDPPPPNIRGILEEVLRFRTPDAPPLPPVPINPDGTLDPWLADPGPPPPQLTAQGFQLQDRASLGDSGLRFDLEPAATWLALQDSPPSWLGTSPNGTPALVVAPGHIVLVSHVIPPEADLRLARPTASKPLPIALLTGSSDGLSIPLPPDVLPLDRAIRHLALDRDHLNELANYQYSRERTAFVEPKCRFGSSKDAPSLLGLAALTRWLHSDVPAAVLAGAIGDGRTTLLRTWLIDIARDALLRDALSVRYIDATDWRAHSHISALLAALTPKQRAALRLAITTGNCLLVLDGIDDILPDLTSNQPFVNGWLSPRGVRVLQASCWTPKSGAVIRLRPANEREPWIPRILLRARTLEQRDHPPFEQMAALVAKLDRTLSATATDQPTTTHLLEDLAHAIWSRPRATMEKLDWIHQAEFDRARSARRPRATSVSADQTLIVLAAQLSAISYLDRPKTPKETPLWRWHSLRRALARSFAASSDGSSWSDRWLSIPSDALFNFLLAQRIVDDLAQGEASVLDTLPLYHDTVDYCIRHPSWSDARATVQSLLTAPPSTPAASVNALLLAIADGSPHSTAEAPWRLEGLDLRGLPLADSHLVHAHLAGARFDHSTLTSARLHGADFSDASLEDCDLSNADLSHITAPRARLTGTVLDGTSFQNADLSGADLSRSLVHAHAPNFDGANLRDTIARATNWPSLPADLATRATWPAPSAAPDHIDEIVPTPLYLDDGALAWSRDDHIIATSDHHGRLWLWSSGPLRALAMLPAHRGPLRAIAFSTDGQLIATAGDDASVRLWSLADLTPRGHIPHEQPVSGVFWEDPTTLWTFSGGTPRRWSIAPSIDLLETVNSISDAYEGTLTPDGNHLVTVTRDPTRSEPRFAVYQRADFTPLHTLDSHSARLPALNLARGLVACDTSFAVLVVGLLNPGVTVRKVTDTQRPNNDGFPKDTWSSDGTLLASIHDPPIFWDVDSGARTHPKAASLPNVRGLLFSNLDDRLLALLALHESSIAVISPASDILTELPHARRFRCDCPVMRWTAAGIRLDNDHHHVQIDLNTAHITHRVITTPGVAAFSVQHRDPHGNRHLVFDAQGPSIWNENESRQLYLDPAPQPATDEAPTRRDVLWSQDGNIVGIQQYTSQRVDIDFWDAHSGRFLRREPLSHRGPVVLVQDDIPRPLSASATGEHIHLIDPAQSRRLTIQLGQPTTSFLSGDASHIALRSLTSQLQVVASKTFLGLLAKLQPGQNDTVNIRRDQPLWTSPFPPDLGAIVFSPPNDRLAVVMARQVEIRRTSTGVTLATLPTETRAATSVTFSPDGRHLVCYSNGELQVWNIDPAQLIARLVLLRNPSNALAGAVVIAGPKYQRLAPLQSPPPSLEGFYARTSVHLHPLDRLAHLESTTLCADLWNTLSGNANAPQSTPQE